MNTRVLKSLFIAAFIFNSYLTHCQNQMLVTMNDGSTETIPVSAIRSIKFGISTMNINKFDGTVVTKSISDIQQYSFSDATSIPSEIVAANASVSLFPNPANEYIDIAYTNSLVDKIDISFFDSMGRKVVSVFNGNHQPKQIYKQALRLPSGVYFCRITSSYESISTPFFIN